MTDFKLPDLPSDEELGITDEDREGYDKDEPSELSEEERRALGIGEEPPVPPGESRRRGRPGSAPRRRPAPAAAGAARLRWRS